MARQSVFSSETTVTVDGTDYKLVSDVTLDGLNIFRVVNTETGESGTCRRDGDEARLTHTSTLTHDMEDALAEEVSVVIPKGYTRADVGEGER